MNKALLIVDLQVDFISGSLAVEGGSDVALSITTWVTQHHLEYETIVATRDWHIEPQEHFASYLQELPNYTTTWPDHCKAGTPGSEFHPGFVLPAEAYVFSKGQFAAAYSGFQGTFYDPWSEKEITLDEFLKQNNIDELDICGIATSHCVKATVLDGIDLEYKVNILTNLCVGIDQEQANAALVDMQNLGAIIN